MIDLITVVFREELPLLKIQARSICQYLNPQHINCIYVIVNDHDDVALDIDVAWWQHFQHCVKIIPMSHWNYQCRVSGWENQQLLKLLAAANAVSEWSMVLDAKTWFVRPVNLHDLFDSEQRANVGLCPVFPQFVDSQQFVQQHFDIVLDQVIGPAGVPFLFHTQSTQQLINSETDFIDFFQTALRWPHLATEFHLYSGWILKCHGSYDRWYNKTQYYECANLADWQANEFDSFLFRSQHNSKIATASIHRRAYLQLSAEQIKSWCCWLHELGLIDDIDHTAQQLNTINQTGA